MINFRGTRSEVREPSQIQGQGNSPVKLPRRNGPETNHGWRWKPPGTSFQPSAKASRYLTSLALLKWSTYASRPSLPQNNLWSRCGLAYSGSVQSPLALIHLRRQLLAYVMDQSDEPQSLMLRYITPMIDGHKAYE